MLSGLDSTQLPADAVEVGRIADAWGLKGWFKVLPYSALPEALFSSKRWILLPTEKARKSFSGARMLAIKEAREQADCIVATAHGVECREAAQALRGARVFVARSSFPTAGRDEFYWVDLIGLEVINRQGEYLGTVRELLATGSQTVIVIEYLLDGKLQDRMIPFVSVYIDDVDLAARCINVDWQADY
jgi:16S rRNA processing protein RimM